MVESSSMITNMMATDISRSMQNPTVGTPNTLWNQAPVGGEAWGLGSRDLGSRLGLCSELHGLISIWWRDPSYSHGFLVIPIALVILWQRLSGTAT